MQFPTQSPNCPISSGDSGIELAPTSPGLSVDVDTRLETLLRNDAFEDVASANGYLTVHDYEPASANFKTPVLLTVVLTYTDLVLSDATLIQLRLNVGSKYIPTSVRPGSKSVLELHAVLSTDLLARSGRHISLSVHAYRNEKIFDSCDFGFLTALVDQATETSVASTPTRPHKRLYSDFGSSDEEYIPKSPSKSKKNTVRSRANAGGSKRLPTLLVIKGDLGAVTDSSSWSKTEENEGRRLVHFSRHQTGHRIQLFVGPITRADLVRTEGVTVNCLKPPGQENCYITSADLVRLTTLLINPSAKMLGIEEKNRIRRSLESFEPATVKKDQSESVGLFNYLMCITEPRPITIAKDIKIFKWCILKEALEKILAKYDYDPESHALFEHAMSRKVSHPKVPHKARAADVPTSNIPPIRKALPPSICPRRVPLPLQLPPIQFLLPEVFVQSPEHSRSSPQLSSGRSQYSRSPSPSGPSVSTSPDPQRSTVSAPHVEDVLSEPGPELLVAELLTRLHQLPTRCEDDNYDDDDDEDGGDGECDNANAQDRLVGGVQGDAPPSPSQASSNSPTDENTNFLSTIQTWSRVETSQERFSLAHTYSRGASPPARGSPDGMDKKECGRPRQFSRSLTVPPVSGDVSWQSRPASVTTGSDILMRVPPCTPTKETSDEIALGGGNPVEDFVDLLLALEEHIANKGDNNDDERTCVGLDCNSQV